MLWELLSRTRLAEEAVGEHKLPFEEEVGSHPTLSEMLDCVVERKQRPPLKSAWKAHPVQIFTWPFPFFCLSDVCFCFGGSEKGLVWLHWKPKFCIQPFLCCGRKLGILLMDFWCLGKRKLSFCRNYVKWWRRWRKCGMRSQMDAWLPAVRRSDSGNFLIHQPIPAVCHRRTSKRSHSSPTNRRNIKNSFEIKKYWLFSEILQFFKWISVCTRSD